MQKMGPAKRLQTLIDYLDTDQFRVCPQGVGLKTAIQARELGLVEFREEGGRWTYRLTTRGCEYKASVERAIVGHHLMWPLKRREARDFKSEGLDVRNVLRPPLCTAGKKRRAEVQVATFQASVRHCLTGSHS